MEPNSSDDLREILRRLDQLDGKLWEMDQRLKRFEHHAEPGDERPIAGAFHEHETMHDAAVKAAEREAVEPPVLPVPSPPVPPPLSQVRQAAPADLPGADSNRLPEIPIPPRIAEAANAIAESSASPEHGDIARYHEAVAQLNPRVLERKPKQSLEVRIATTWLPWIGLLFLALVCVLFAREFSKGPVGKVVACYIGAASFIVLGLLKEKKYPRWANPVLAGGLAFSYFASYAVGFVEPMRLLDSLPQKLLLLGANLVLMFGVAHWKKSEIIGGTALILGYITTGVVGNDQASFGSALALSAVALVFLWLNRWFVATALAAIATYMAHFYVWKALPEVDLRTPIENFWYHTMFLSMYFAVFTAAALTGKRAVKDELEGADEESLLKAKPYSRFRMLLLLTQTNVAAYLGGMVTVLKLTEVYWDQAWMFFFPMVAVCGLLGLMFTGFAAVQMVYIIAGTLCLSFGIIALASPAWLPVLLAVQGLAMVWRASGPNHKVWGSLGLLVMLYAVLYLLTRGAIDTLRFSPVTGSAFPLWTHLVLALMVLVAAMRWEKPPMNDWANLKFLIAATAAAVMVPLELVSSGKDALLFHSVGFVLAAMSVSLFRLSAPLVFATAMLAMSLSNLGEVGGLDDTNNWHSWSLVVLSLVAFAIGLDAEKRRTTENKRSRILWRLLYIWAPIMLAVNLLNPLPDTALRWAGLTALFAVLTGVAWMAQSAAIGKSAYVLLPLYLPIITTSDSLLVENSSFDAYILASGIILTAAVFPVSLPRWKYRTGDTNPAINEIGQAVALAIAGISVVWGTSLFKNTNHVFLMGCWGAGYALYSALGRFRGPAILIVFAVLAAWIQLLYDLGNGVFSRGVNDTVKAVNVGWSIAGVLLFVVAERILSSASRLAIAGANPGERWFNAETRKSITAALAIATLGMVIIALRTLPDLRLFYFTGAIVAAAFLWIVFGFLFNENVYRKSGFLLLCMGIVKGLVWDVLSLKDTMHRLVSWTVLGLLALAASFIYTRYKGRLELEADQVEGEAPRTDTDTLP